MSYTDVIRQDDKVREGYRSVHINVVDIKPIYLPQSGGYIKPAVCELPVNMVKNRSLSEATLPLTPLVTFYPAEGLQNGWHPFRTQK